MRETDGRLGTGRWPWLAAGLMSAIFGVLVWLQRVPALTTRHDDLVYLLMSREVARFSYAQTWLVGAPIHNHYPPGFPGWLSSLSLIFGEQMSVFVFANILLMVGALLLLFAAVRRLWSLPTALLMLAIVVTNPLVQRTAAGVVSEALYLFCVSLTVWAVTVKPVRTRWLVLVGAGAVAATLTRSIGLALLGALAVTWLQERRWRALGALILPAVLASAAWLGWALLAPGQESGTSYIAEGLLPVISDQSLGSILRHAVAQAWEYWSRLVPAALSLPLMHGTVIDNLAWLGLVTGLTVLGLGRLWSTWRIVFWYLMAYATILVLWQWGNERMLMPIVPFLVVTFLACLDYARGSRLRVPLTVAVAVLVTGMLAGGIHETTQQVRSRLACDRSRLLESPACLNDDERGMLTGALWIAANLPPDDAVLSFKEGAAAYYGEHRVVRASRRAYEAWIDEPDDMLEQIRATGARYILLDHIHPFSRGLGKALTSFCDRLGLVRTFSAATLLFDLEPAASTVSPPADSAPQADACGALEVYQASPLQERWIW